MVHPPLKTLRLEYNHPLLQAGSCKNISEGLLILNMHLSLILVVSTYLAIGSINALKQVTYYCDGSSSHQSVRDICKNTCWGANCLKLVCIWFEKRDSAHADIQGWQFTYDSSLRDQNRAVSGYNVPSGVTNPCEPGSPYGDDSRTSIDEFPIAASQNPGNVYSLRCVNNKDPDEQKSKRPCTGLIVAVPKTEKVARSRGQRQNSGTQQR